MTKSVLGAMCLSLAFGLATIGCGDDDQMDDNAVTVDTPGVDVNVEELGSAGSAAAQE